MTSGTKFSPSEFGIELLYAPPGISLKIDRADQARQENPENDLTADESCTRKERPHGEDAGDQE